MASAPRVADKPLCVLANIHHHKHTRPISGMLDERQLACDQLSANPLITWDTWREQADCWTIHDNYAFELSPMGNGMDCYRTWEALLLNTIPITRTCPLDQLHRQYPIVIVQSWDEITAENLARWRAELAPLFTNELRYRLTTHYWASQMRSKQCQLRK